MHQHLIRRLSIFGFVGRPGCRVPLLVLLGGRFLIGRGRSGCGPLIGRGGLGINRTGSSVRRRSRAVRGFGFGLRGGGGGVVALASALVPARGRVSPPPATLILSHWWLERRRDIYIDIILSHYFIYNNDMANFNSSTSAVIIFEPALKPVLTTCRFRKDSLSHFLLSDSESVCK